MDLARKDLHFAHMMGREFGVPLELASVTEQQFARARAMYSSGARSPMVVKMLEEAVRHRPAPSGFPPSSPPMTAGRRSYDEAEALEKGAKRKTRQT